MKHRHHLTGTCRVGEGERFCLSLLFRPPEDFDKKIVEVPELAELDQRLEETIRWWRTWVGQIHYQGLFAEQLKRSALVLKGLVNAPTGAIIAAGTTSLPEEPGGSRNWDYRYTWIRDSCFAVRSLTELGSAREAEGFRRFVERSAAGSAEELQILFGIGGERRLTEQDIKELDGYRGASPVRIGNDAETQKQLDVYGELLDLSWHWHKKGRSPDEDYWEFLRELVEEAASRWRDPDRGIWEMRGRPRHFVLSKAMCWSALDYGIRLADELGREAPIGKWRNAQEEIRQAIETRGYDPQRRVFVQAFDNKAMDASLLLMPAYGFINYDDERMVRTTDAIREGLEQQGLLRRYPAENDGLPGREGVFLPCSFWLVNCLARQGRKQEAEAVFRRALDTGNDLGLFSEEYDTEAEEMLGNFPQALTHLSLITAALALQGASSQVEE
jgi:GH15 family glucan-1,4-alpha-glucosidase